MQDQGRGLPCAGVAVVTAWVGLFLMCLALGFECHLGEWRKQRELAKAEAAARLEVERKTRTARARRQAQEEADRRFRQLQDKLAQQRRIREEQERQRQEQEHRRRLQEAKRREEKLDTKCMLRMLEQLKLVEQNADDYDAEVYARYTHRLVFYFYSPGDLPRWRANSKELDSLLTRWEKQGLVNWQEVQLQWSLDRILGRAKALRVDPRSKIREVENLLAAHKPETLSQWRAKHKELDELLAEWEGLGVVLPGQTLAKWHTNINRWNPELLWKQPASDPYPKKALRAWEERGLQVPPDPAKALTATHSTSK